VTSTLERIQNDMKGKSLMQYLGQEIINKMGLRSRQALLDWRNPDYLSAGAVVQVQMISSKTSKKRTTLTGVVIAVRRHGVATNFTIRNRILDEGVEITLPLFSPMITNIRVLRRERVRRAKLYYLRRSPDKDMVIADASSGGR